MRSPTRTQQITRAVSDGTGLMPQQVELRVAATALGAAVGAAGVALIRVAIPLMDAWPRHS